MVIKVANKKKANSNSRYIPVKNYVYAGLMLVAVILLCWYCLSWHNVKKQDRYSESYLISTGTLALEITNIEEIPEVLNETPSEYFVLISYTGDSKIEALEKDLKKIIDNYGIKDETYYVNVTKAKEDNKLYNDLSTVFNTNKIKNVPCILYFVNNELEDVIIDKNDIFDAEEFEDLLNKQNYDKISE